MPLNQQARRGVIVLSGVTDLDRCGKLGQPSATKGRKMVLNTGDSLGCVLVLTFPVINASGRPQGTCQAGRTANGPDTPGMRVWGPPHGTELPPAKEFVERKENTECEVEEGSY